MKKGLKYIVPLLLLSAALWTSVSSRVAPLSTFPGAEEVLEKMRKNLSEKESMTYSIAYKVRCFNCEDTTYFTANAKLLRDDKDTLNHGYIEFIRPDSIETIYDMENVYDIQHKKKKLSIYNPYVYKSNPLNAEPYGMAIFEDFLIANLKPSAKIKNTMIDTFLVDKKWCYAVQSEYPESGRITDIKRIAYIDRITFMPVKMVNTSIYNGNVNYESFTLSNINFNTVKKEEFIPTKALARCTVNYFQPLAIPVKKDAPMFDAALLQDKKAFQLSSAKGQVILLGFWKPNAAGTNSALQYLGELKQANESSNIAVIGIPAFKGTDPEKAKAIVTEKNITYTTLYPAKSTDSTYRVKSFPAFYVIDRSGKITYRSIGYYSPAIKDSLQKAIERAGK